MKKYLSAKQHEFLTLCLVVIIVICFCLAMCGVAINSKILFITSISLFGIFGIVFLFVYHKSLKKGLMTIIGETVPVPRIETYSSDLDLLTVEIVISEDKNEKGQPIEWVFNRKVESAREKLFEEFLKYVTIDTKSFIDNSNVHKIRLSVFVAKRKSI